MGLEPLANATTKSWLAEFVPQLNSHFTAIQLLLFLVYPRQLPKTIGFLHSSVVDSRIPQGNFLNHHVAPQIKHGISSTLQISMQNFIFPIMPVPVHKEMRNWKAQQDIEKPSVTCTSSERNLASFASSCSESSSLKCFAHCHGLFCLSETSGPVILLDWGNGTYCAFHSVDLMR